MAATEIKFKDTTFDLKAISESRILSQYSTSPLYKLLLEALTSEVQELSKALKDLMEYRTVAKAEGKQLDVIGRIVGIDRQMFTYDNEYWFAPEIEGVAPDNGHWWVKNSPQAVVGLMDDTTYRKWIWLKILKNHNKFSSKPEIENEILEGLEEEIGIQRTGMIEQDIYTTPQISTVNKNMLSYVKDTPLTDNQYMFSYPAATKVGSVTDEQES